MREEVQDTLKYSYWTMPADIELQPLMPNHLALSFFVYVSGIGLAVIVFAITTVHHKLQKPEHSEGKSTSRAQEDGNYQDENNIITLVEL